MARTPSAPNRRSTATRRPNRYPRQVTQANTPEADKSLTRFLLQRSSETDTRDLATIGKNTG